jgi:hypothetical protein
VLHRFRVLRLSRTQRLVALRCVFALASPWLTAIVAGLALGFTDPFTPLWFGALLLGFAGAGGLLLSCILHVARVYLVRFDRFPFVGVDASRREAIRGGAAALLWGGAIVASFAAGRSPFGESWPPYHGREPVVYERDDLRMVAEGDPVRLGEPIASRSRTPARWSRSLSGVTYLGRSKPTRRDGGTM